ncbi:MAG: DUF2508 family protein [Firmicutes bacterium]|nr:DUF2508 family protein [Bacillota bacterium]
MFAKARARLEEWFRSIAPEDTEAASAPTPEEMLEDARRQLHAARAYFHNVSDPELVDYAIKSLELAERRYDYLLKLVRNP